jgi:broad specificity phosphatase PhoE
MNNNILKRFYFVRHGQTEDNVNNIYQSTEDKLTEKGKEQATLVAGRFVSIPNEIIIASDYERAKETAEVISKKTGTVFRISELFREIRRPSDIIGKEKQKPESKQVMAKIIENELNGDWHYLDEENLFEAVARARRALNYLCALPEENIVIVTHEMFTKILLSAMANSEDVKAVEFYRTMRYFMIGDNTGITIAEYGNFINDNCFRLRIWNDHAHLGLY